MTKIGTFHVILLFVVYFKFFFYPFWFFSFAFTSLFTFPLLMFFIFKFRQQQFYSEFLRFLSVVILRMQRGESFTMAQQRALASENWKQDLLIKSLMENVAFSQQNKAQHSGLFGHFLGELQSELLEVLNNQHQAIDRLCNLRKTLRSGLIFRQKSRQIWAYFGYQFGILSLIYLGILYYIVMEVGFYPFRTSFFLSFLFYFSGVLALIFIVRRKKWRI